MIFIKLNEADFEYDLYSLFKAFYPHDNLLVTAGDKEPDEQVILYGEITYAQDRINCKLFSAMQCMNENPDDADISANYTQFPCIMEKSVDVDYVNLSELPEGATPRVISNNLRKETKNRLKRLVYDMLSELTGQELPWGTLTGIRPTKIALAFYEGAAPEQYPEIRGKVRDYMSSTYYTSPEKISQSIQIAEKEHSLLSAFDYPSGYSLYIGIPFCPTRCAYCSFTAYPIGLWKSRVEEYLTCVKKELAFVAEQYKNKPLHTIYMGGGTPTTLTGAQFDDLFSFIEEKFDLSNLREFTVEGGRPDSITQDNMAALRRHGITRISINPQTMNQKTLDLIGRHHTVEQIKESFLLARDLGFENINMDIILGLPEEGMDEVRHTLEEIAKLRPDSLTVHSLAMKRAARLTTEHEKFENYTMTNSNERMHLVQEYAKILGLEPYYLYRQKNMAGNLENVGYAAPGKEGLYNILIMEEKQTIISVGAAGMTKVVRGDRPERVSNVKDVASYLDRIDEMIERKRELLTDGNEPADTRGTAMK